MSMITATAWIPRGHAAAFPTKYVFDDDEYGRIAKLAKLQLEDAEGDLEGAREAENGSNSRSKSKSKEYAMHGPRVKCADVADRDSDDDNDLKEYDLEHYDSSDNEESDGQRNKMGMFGNIKDLAYHDNDAEDPYITLEGVQEDDDEEREDMQILPTDNLLLAARIEDEVAHLEVYVYEDGEENLYVHHDIMLPAYPLCVEWLNFAAGSRPAKGSNFVAVGTMDPDIEVWDLDTVDCMYPNAILGSGELQSEVASKKKSKKKKKKKPNDAYHVDAVLSLSANTHHRNLLASSSADTTVKLWDLQTTKCAQSYSMHADKVCATAWHPKEATVLLTGSYDKTIVATDMRAPGAKAPKWEVESDVETVKWDVHSDEIFYVS
jgi:periodic tryptophan protein 1